MLLGRQRELEATGVRLERRRAAIVVGEAGLSRREAEVLALVARGLRSPDIARELGIARTTVETHAGAAMRKLGTRSRIQAAALVAAPPEVAGAEALTDEQRLVLDLVRQGRTHREIAVLLRVSRRTLDRRLADARTALRAATTVEAALAARPVAPTLAQIDDVGRATGT